MVSKNTITLLNNKLRTASGPPVALRMRRTAMKCIPAASLEPVRLSRVPREMIEAIKSSFLVGEDLALRTRMRRKASPLWRIITTSRAFFSFSPAYLERESRYSAERARMTWKQAGVVRAIEKFVATGWGRRRGEKP